MVAPLEPWRAALKPCGLKQNSFKLKWEEEGWCKNDMDQAKVKKAILGSK